MKLKEIILKKRNNLKPKIVCFHRWIFHRKVFKLLSYFKMKINFLVKKVFLVWFVFPRHEEKRRKMNGARNLTKKDKPYNDSFVKHYVCVQ